MICSSYFFPWVSPFVFEQCVLSFRNCTSYFFLKYLYSRALFSRLSLFNFQGPSLPRSAGQLVYHITFLLSCQYLFLSFLKNFRLHSRDMLSPSFGELFYNITTISNCQVLFSIFSKKVFQIRLCDMLSSRTACI